MKRYECFKCGGDMRKKGDYFIVYQCDGCSLLTTAKPPEPEKEEEATV